MIIPCNNNTKYKIQNEIFHLQLTIYVEIERGNNF